MARKSDNGVLYVELIWIADRETRDAIDRVSADVDGRPAKSDLHGRRIANE